MTEYFNQIHNGFPLTDVEIIDLHAHLGPHRIMHVPANDPASMVKIMDLCGINKTVVSPIAGIDSDIVLGNNIMLEAIRAHRERIYGACLVNGHYPELSLDELQRCFSEDRDVKMIKVHPFLTNCNMKDKRMKNIFEFASDRKLVILVHTWLDNDQYGNQDIFAELAKDYPEIKWIMGHSGGPYGSYHAVELAKENKNIFLDITLSMAPARQIEFFVSEIGSERVIFGTDNPFIDPRPQIGRVGLADVSHQDRVNIFSANAHGMIDF